MSAYHPDKHIENLHNMDVHIRVGATDMTTHPWYSRRMHRLLTLAGTNATLEEVTHFYYKYYYINIHTIERIITEYHNFCGNCRLLIAIIGGGIQRQKTTAVF